MWIECYGREPVPLVSLPVLPFYLICISYCVCRLPVSEGIKILIDRGGIVEWTTGFEWSEQDLDGCSCAITRVQREDGCEGH